MNFELASQAGTEPKLKGPDVLQVGKLIHALAERYESIPTADRAWELAAEYLRDAVLCDVDMADQTSRWQAFQHLERKEAKHTILHDAGTRVRYVRTAWLTEYLRQHCDPGESAAMKDQLGRHGWRKAGKEGRIKATHPGVPKSLIWAFLIVPEGWEDVDPGFEAPKVGDGR